MTTQTTPGNAVPCGYQQIIDLTNAVKLVVPNGARWARIVAESQAVRWTDDGKTAPTAAVGMPLAAGADPWIYDGNLGEIQFIQQAAGAKLNVSYYA